jgi:raffinose/stachyose/melibiose transport system substrate-binding protein
MKKILALVLALTLCLSALNAVAETKVSFFTGKIETIDLLNGIIEEFNAANPGIVVEQEYQNDASSVIKVKFASGEVPDVMTTYEQEFVDQGKYLDLSDMSDWWGRLVSSMKDSCTDLKTGKQYRVCTNIPRAVFL